MITEFSPENWPASSARLKDLIDNLDKWKTTKKRAFFWFIAAIARNKIKKYERELSELLGDVSGDPLQQARAIYSRMTNAAFNNIDGTKLKQISFANLPLVTRRYGFYLLFSYNYFTREDFIETVGKAAKDPAQPLSDNDLGNLYDLYAGPDGFLEEDDWNHFVNSF